jgi:hypothetical protein
MDRDPALRALLARLLDWEEAHVSFDSAVSDIPPSHRGRVPEGLPYSPWQLVEHLRLTQLDILDFCRNPSYTERHFPDDYWPASPEPRSEAAWTASLAGYRDDREALKHLAGDRNIDLFARIPHGTGQTYLRELVLVADHTAYHVGQLVAVRRALGIWSPK